MINYSSPSLRFGASVGIAIAGVLAIPANVNAAVIVSFDADSAVTAPDPMTPAGGNWTGRRAFPSAGNPPGSGAATPPTNRTSGNEVINGTSYNYTTFNSVSGTAIGALAYDLAGTPALEVGNPTGWTATVTARVLEATIAGGKFGNHMRVWANGREHVLVMINDAANDVQGVVLWRSNYSTSSSDPNYYLNYLIPFDVSSDYVTYQLYYDPELLSTTLYINGTAVDTAALTSMSTSSSNVYSAGLNRALEWGKSTANGSVNTHWNQVRFETGYAVIPEPSTVMLIGTGLAGVALLRRKRSRSGTA